MNVPYVCLGCISSQGNKHSCLRKGCKCLVCNEPVETNPKMVELNDKVAKDRRRRAHYGKKNHRR